MPELRYTKTMKSQTLRIIAGKLRGRKFTFPALPGLRPTGDRLRETVFNWLQSAVVGARCLDLFAGSGALGFEALSRGAAEVVLFDSARDVVRQLKETAENFALKNIQIAQAQFPELPSQQPFDIIFIDPPFHQGLAQVALDYIVEKNLIAPSGFLYLEVEKTFEVEFPASCNCLKEKVIGDVKVYLASVF